MADASPRLSTGRLILVPVILTLGVSLLRLYGERQGWDPRFFSKEAGGGSAVVGISWLPILFGIYFAIRLIRDDRAPSSPGRAIGYALVGMAIAGGAAFGIFKSNLDYTMKGLLFNAAMALGGLIAAAGWTCLARVDAAYGLFARIPVVVIAWFAMKGKWGTHYEQGPPGFPEMDMVHKWFWLALLPQLVLWVGWTVMVGGLFGGITSLFVKTKR